MDGKEELRDLVRAFFPSAEDIKKDAVDSSKKDKKKIRQLSDMSVKEKGADSDWAIKNQSDLLKYINAEIQTRARFS